MRPIVVTVGPLATADADGIAETQTPGAGLLTLDGAFVTDGVAVLDVQRQILLTTTADETGATFTYVGTDWQGNPISETVTGVNNTTVATALSFKTVTSVTISINAADALTVGTNGVASSPNIPLDWNGRPEVSLQVVVTGTVNWTVQQTLDTPYTYDALTWIDHPDANMVAETVNRQGSYVYIPAAARVNINSGAGSLVFTVIQAGIQG